MRELLDGMVIDDVEPTEAARELEAMGRASVLPLIASMNDRRPLRRPSLTLVNHSPNAFEGARHYGPTVVLEAVAAVLNQLTGESFGCSYNGSTEAMRSACVRGWRIYGHCMGEGGG